MSNTTIQATKATPKFVNKGQQRTFPKKSTSAYENMVVLKRDLYYKSIVVAHASELTAKTEFAIKDLLWQNKRGHISRGELFTGIEALYSGYACTDTPVSKALKQLRGKK